MLKLKDFGIVLLAICGLAAVDASAASAKIVHDFEAEKTPYILTGKTTEPETLMKWSAGAAMACSASSFNGTVKTSPVSEITLEPMYEGCSVSALPATMDTPCTTLFTGETTSFGHGTVHIECPAETVRITINGCTIEIGGQTPEQGARYTSTGAGNKRDVDVEVTMTNTKYTLLGAGCSLIAGLAGELSIVGRYTFQAYEDKAGAEGAQIGFWTKATIS
jgi:hypothetical protein